MIRRRFRLMFLLLSFGLLLGWAVGCGRPGTSEDLVPIGTIAEKETMAAETESVDDENADELSDLYKKYERLLSVIPEYSGEPYVEINGNKPLFAEAEMTTEAFERYSELDALGRCGQAYGNICRELMPTGERGPIGHIKPTGWHTVKYNDLIEGNYLYNRCHLIAFKLAGENDNERNLITGTRYFNTTGMQPFEFAVDDYVRGTGNHVLYRVTPWFEGRNLVASGVIMEAISVEDAGAGVCFCVYLYNVQPGISIDYATGESCAADDLEILKASDDLETPEVLIVPGVLVFPEDAAEESVPDRAIDAEPEVTYVGNANSKKFHKPSCSSVSDMKEHNKREFYGDRSELIDAGYQPCKRCKP